MPNCSKCNRSTQGHPRPWGPACTQEPIDITVDISTSDFKDLSAMASMGARPKVSQAQATAQALPHDTAKTTKYKLLDPMSMDFFDSIKPDDKKNPIDDFTGKDIYEHFMKEHSPQTPSPPSAHVGVSSAHVGDVPHVAAMQDSFTAMTRQFSEMMSSVQIMMQQFQTLPAMLAAASAKASAPENSPPAPMSAPAATPSTLPASGVPISAQSTTLYFFMVLPRDWLWAP